MRNTTCRFVTDFSLISELMIESLWLFNCIWDLCKSENLLRDIILKHSCCAIMHFFLSHPADGRGYASYFFQNVGKLIWDVVRSWCRSMTSHNIQNEIYKIKELSNMVSYKIELSFNPNIALLPTWEMCPHTTEYKWFIVAVLNLYGQHCWSDPRMDR